MIIYLSITHCIHSYELYHYVKYKFPFKEALEISYPRPFHVKSFWLILLQIGGSTYLSKIDVNCGSLISYNTSSNSLSTPFNNLLVFPYVSDNTNFCYRETKFAAGGCRDGPTLMFIVISCTFSTWMKILCYSFKTLETLGSE